MPKKAITVYRKKPRPKRTEQIQLVLTPSEKAGFETSCEDKGKTMSAVIRAKIKPDIDEGLQILAKEMQDTVENIRRMLDEAN